MLVCFIQRLQNQRCCSKLGNMVLAFSLLINCVDDTESTSTEGGIHPFLPAPVWVHWHVIRHVCSWQITEKANLRTALCCKMFAEKNWRFLHTLLTCCSNSKETESSDTKKYWAWVPHSSGVYLVFHCVAQLRNCIYPKTFYANLLYYPKHIYLFVW